MELISKISTKTVYGSVNAKTPEDASVKKHKGALYRVFGIANDVRHGESTYGTYTEFRGDFRAVNMHTGVEFGAGKCFLPTIASNLLEGQFSDDMSSVQFAFDIGVKASEQQAGFEYTVTPLVKPAEGDPLSGLANSLPALPKIPAPKKKAAS